MNVQTVWPRNLVIVGGLAMLFGAIDPLEGSGVILIGSALVLIGTLFGDTDLHLRRYWTAVFLLIVVGVGIMFALSSMGGIGGDSGYSMWWGLLVLPYPVGWVMGMASLIVRMIRNLRHGHVAT